MTPLSKYKWVINTRREKYLATYVSGGFIGQVIVKCIIGQLYTEGLWTNCQRLETLEYNFCAEHKYYDHILELEQGDRKVRIVITMDIEWSELKKALETSSITPLGS